MESASVNQHHLQAGGIVLIDGKVLLRKTPTNHWIFPKGHVEPGETLLEAAVREVEEETGVQAIAERYLTTSNYTLGEERYEVHLFSMKYLGTTVSWRDHHGRDSFLIPPDEARGLLSYDDYRVALDLALVDPPS